MLKTGGRRDRLAAAFGTAPGACGKSGGMTEKSIDGAAGHGDLPVAFDRDLAAAVIEAAIERFIAARHARVPAFVDRNFALRGALRLHRKAAGWDLLRAPANLMLAVPHLGLKVAAAGSRTMRLQRTARWLDRRHLYLTSAVTREVEWRLFTELLELPYAQSDRVFHRDALAEEILRDPRVDAALGTALAAIGRRADEPGFRQWLTEAMATYAGTRVAAGDLASALITAGVGALTFKQLTPGMISLGPAVAQALAQHLAVAGFPLGAGLGGLWYGAMPAAAPLAAVVGVTGGMMAAVAMFAAFSGVVTDPLQRRLGVHRRRLHRLVDSLGGELSTGRSHFVVRDHYVARLVDLLDVLNAAYRVAR